MPETTIVKIHVQSQKSSFRSPTSSPALQSNYGSGWVCDALQVATSIIPFIPEAATSLSVDEIKDKLLSLGIKPSSKGTFPLIVTNAHIVEGMQTCAIQPDESTALFSCKLLCIFPSRDLALLLPPEALIEELTCSTISTEPLSQGTPITVYGYSKAGECSRTDGRLSRVVYKNYMHAGLSTLTYEMSATITGGNSGGPVIVKQGDKEVVVSVAHELVLNTNQLNSIPIFHLAAAFRDFLSTGKYYGLLDLPITDGFLTNRVQRSYFGLDPAGSNGIVVKTVSSKYDFPLKPGDILLQVDDFPINSEGKIALFPQTRVPFSCYLHFLPPNHVVKLHIIRQKQALIVDYELNLSLHMMLRDFRLPNQNPPIFYQHGLIFRGELSGPSIIHEYTGAQGNRTPHKLYNRVSEITRFKEAQSQGSVVFFPRTETLGYVLDEVNVISKVEINGKIHHVRDIYHLYHLLNPEIPSSTESSPFIAFYCSDEDEVPYFICRKLTPEEEEEHRARYKVDDRFSPEQFAKTHLPKTKGWEIVREKCRAKFFTSHKQITEAESPSASASASIS